MLSDIFSSSNRLRPGMVIDDSHRSELAMMCHARRKLSAPAVARSKSNRDQGERYVLITSSIIFWNPCIIFVRVFQSLLAVY